MKNELLKFFLMLMMILAGTLCFGQPHKLDSIKIDFEGFDTETPYDIACDAFDYTFSKTKETKTLTQRQTLLRFEFLAKKFESATTQSFDVRGHITYYYHSKPIKYCFGVFGMFYRDGKLYNNKQLLIAISDSFYSNHPSYLDTLKQQ